MSHSIFNVNKYFYWYYNIINNRINNPPAGYFEKHHVIPKCLGGSNDPSNIVHLTAREHFICHLLLVKITTNDANKKMRRAAGMFKMATSRVHRKPTPRQYEIIRKITSNLPNPMNNPEVKQKHLDSIARKVGYANHEEYSDVIFSAFEGCKTIKGTSIKLNQSQHTILQFILKHKGKEWLEKIRKIGLIEARARQKENLPFRKKIAKDGELNPNAYIWQAISPTGEIHIIKGNRAQFCKDHSIGISMNTKKPHLRGFWEFEKICKVKDYDSLKSVNRK
jgi:hypothetical protein